MKPQKNSERQAKPQKNLSPRLAFQGSAGAYSDLACRAVLPDWPTLPCESFAAAFTAVRKKQADLAMIPVENAIAGRVADIHSLLPQGGLHIIGEHYQPVEHHLLAPAGVKLKDIKVARSHIQALTQCAAFLRQHKIKAEPWPDTATAAADIAKNKDPHIAAIASSLAGDLYGLKSLAADIADRRGNMTRFVILARKPSWPEYNEGKNAPRTITSLLFRVRSVPAALYKALGGFATCGINITKLESYIVDNQFTAAQFLADLEGHPDAPMMQHAMAELNFFAEEVKILGVYPAHKFRK